MKIWDRLLHNSYGSGDAASETRKCLLSTISYTSDVQKRVAEDTIADVEASGLWPGKVVIEVVPEGPFWVAESEHQDYLEHYRNGYTCHLVRAGWKLQVRATAAD